MRSIKERINDWLSSIEIYDFKDGKENKYAMIRKGKFDIYSVIDYDRLRIGGNRKYVLEELKIRDSKNVKYKKIPESIAKNMEFPDWNLAYNTVANQKSRWASYFILETREQKNKKWNKFQDAMGRSIMDFI